MADTKSQAQQTAVPAANRVEKPLEKARAARGKVAPPTDPKGTAEQVNQYVRLLTALLGFPQPDWRAVARSARQVSKMAYSLTRVGK
jgi:hypothetical protein